MAAVSAAASTKLNLLRRPNPPLHPSYLEFPSNFSCTLLSSSPPLSRITISLFRSQTPLFLHSRVQPLPVLRAVTEEEAKASPETEVVDGEDGGVLSEEPRIRARPCELYVCNLPRSCDISQLLELFKPFGTVLSVEVSRDAETGISRGCGFVTMSSVPEAKAAIAVLDGSDLGGREMRVKYSADMVAGRRKTQALKTASKKDLVFETPHKAYVGNIAWSVRPEDLREHFSQFGTVVSTRLLYDRKGGTNRVYAFLSFASAEDLKAAVETNGTEFRGRAMQVREIVQ